MAERQRETKSHWPESALLLAGHGSASNPDGAIPLLRHADHLRRRGLFAAVETGFLRQEPEVAVTLESLNARRVFIVPVFASKGHIVDTVMAQALGLTGSVTERQRQGYDQTLCYCEPVGTHPDITRLIGAQVRSVRDDHSLAPDNTDVVLVGHGTHRNPNSAKRTQEVAATLAASGIAASVTPVFLEQEPNVDDWQKAVGADNVIVVPFLIAGGYHGSEDLPGRVGLDAADPALKALSLNVGAAGPYDVSGRKIWYCSPVGNDPGIPDIIVSRVAAFDPGGSS
jgi:sirohydrochlorin cobaltochelatase